MIDVKLNDRQTDQTYPYIGVNDIGNVVYFTNTNTGRLLHKNSKSIIPIEVDIDAEYCDYWIEDKFKVLVTISSQS